MAPPPDGIRDAILRALVFFGVAAVIITESLGAFDLLRRGPLLGCWIAVLIPAMIYLVRRRAFTLARPFWAADPVLWICSAGVLAILTLTAITALFSPPNSSDAMAYHMPRVVYWAEQASVRFFPTPYLNQIMLQPFAEYVMLHTYVVSGGDHLVNLVQWLASVGSAIGVSSVARMFGAGARGQAIAALFCVTLPSGVLASSGAKNDYVLATWLVAAVYFALRFAIACDLGDALFLGAALGLALLTKATAYLFAPFPLAAIVFVRSYRLRRRLLRGCLIVTGVALAVNLPQYARNYELSGSILGFDSAQGDGVYRWRNETFGWKETTSNVLRHVSEQVGARSNAWNQAVYACVIAAHIWMGMDANDPRTTWPYTVFAPPKNANHEANAPNRWHLAVLLIVTAVLVAKALRGRDRLRAAYGLALIGSFVAFCFYLKWQPFSARLLLPLFVLAAPLASIMEEVPGTVVQVVFCLFLLNNARHAVFENWVRPLTGSASVLHASRDSQYFADMTQWNDQATYLRTVDLLAQSDCGVVGIDITDLQLEYPLQALLRERKPGVQFIHTGVLNSSARYREPVATPACAVVCMDCAGDAKRLGLYSGFGAGEQIDKFVVFVARRRQYRSF